MPRCAAPGVCTIAQDTHGLSLLRLQCPGPQWSRPVRIDVCSVVARMPRYPSAQPGIRSATRMRATGQNDSSRHVLALFDSSSRRRNEHSSGLLIRRLGVQVPGGASVSMMTQHRPGAGSSFACRPSSSQDPSMPVIMSTFIPHISSVWRSARACERTVRQDDDAVRVVRFVAVFGKDVADGAAARRRAAAPSEPSRDLLAEFAASACRGLMQFAGDRCAGPGGCGNGLRHDLPGQVVAAFGKADRQGASGTSVALGRPAPGPPRPGAGCTRIRAGRRLRAGRDGTLPRAAIPRSPRQPARDRLALAG